MTRTLWTYLALSVSLLSAGCNAKPPAGGSASAPPPSAAKPAAIAPVSDGQAKMFAESLIRAVSAESGGEELIDWGGVIDRASTGLEMKSKSAKEIRAGIKQGVSSSGLMAQIRSQIKQGGNYKHLRTRQNAEGTRVTMRFIQAAGGVNYHDYLLQDANGIINAIDIHVAASGEDMSQSIRRILIPLVAHESRGILDRLSGKENLLVKQGPNLEEAVKLFQSGQHARALQTLSDLPLELQNEKFILIMQLAAAQGAKDAAAAQQAAERFCTLYPTDPATALVSIDYFYTKKEYPQAIQAVRNLDQAVGGDAHLDILLASLLLQSGDIPGAKIAVDKAIATEPELQSSYLTRLAIAAKEEDNPTILKTLRHLHSDLKVALSAETIRSEPLYAKFILSAEFKELEKLLEQ